MRYSLLPSLLALVISSFISTSAFAQRQRQCTYTAIANGRFSAASTWSSACGGAPTSNSDAIIVINGFSVALDVNYSVAKDGSITVQNSGSLIGGSNLNLGDGTGSQTSTRLSIAPGSRVRVAQLTIDKAQVLISTPPNAASPTTLTTDCNLVLVNADIVDNGQAIIGGSIDLTHGGANNKLCGTGGVRIRGCVFGSNGATNRLANNCASSLTTVCAQMATTGCPGPFDANNASEQECQSLVVCAIVPLPVELAVFTAAATSKRGVALHWVTASEKNSKSFIIERSSNSEDFRELRTVSAAGNTQRYTTYDEVDEEPLPGTSYYRLRQVDLDGKSYYSPVQAVKVGNASAESLAVYPGRTEKEWVVSTTLPAESLIAPTTVVVYDALGRQHQAPCTPDANQTGRWTLDLKALPTGVYIVRLTSLAGTFSQRIAQ
jgi:hypothetical protein